jgi:hypothetical protein
MGIAGCSVGGNVAARRSRRRARRLTALRHNPRVSRLARLACLLCLSLAAAAGCDRDAPSRRPATMPGGTDGDAVAWRGLMACADCDGIDTWLELERMPGPRYRLVEVFVTGDGEVRFEERGDWRREGRVLILGADDGGERVFGVEADGRLSLLDAHGMRSAGAGRVLEPATPAPPP